MIVIGIESSAHTFGVGVVKNGKILANEKKMYDVGASGMIPAEVAEFHVENSGEVLETALGKSGMNLEDVDGIGYTKGPGLGPCLQVGQMTAKTLATRLGVELVPVNHSVAHVEITKHVTGLIDPVALYVSGGNSQILKIDNKPYRHYRILGETFDIGVGNMLDSFARAAGLKPAWGSTVAKLAEGGRYTAMPYTVKGMDFAFTGLLTRATELAAERKMEDVCYSLQETSFAMLCEATERALLLTNSVELCTCGGVAQSKRLKEMLGSVCDEHKIKFGFASDDLNADNGAMIAVTAEKMLEQGYRAGPKECGIEQRYRVDRAVVF
ncbi:tRNA N6-adenosine threonylcarbamoyltransferase [uncultured archaeon]|nr:tRNA N6-adenosine threonylcarbamoyltransferase [uncultured archaeon]